MSGVEVSRLACGYPGTPVLREVSFSVQPGEALTIVGPNGSGKSTLLRVLSGSIPPTSGELRVDGVKVGQLDARSRARLISMLLQNQPLDPGITVRELVSLGRTPHLGRLGNLTRLDNDAIESAIGLCDLNALSARPVGTISGGERQRARIAMVIAQTTSLILLDEPTNHLDVEHRYMLFRIVEKVRQQRSCTVLMVSHSLEDARRFGDRILHVHGGTASVFERDAFDDLRARIVSSSNVPSDWVY